MKQSAFTLVELLVVIAIIVLLIGILIPAVNMAREAVRRGQCITRQRDVALAMMTFNNDNNGLPGYFNQLGKLPVHSWVVSVFPQVGENKRYEALMVGEPLPAETLASLPAFLCPTDNPSENARINYVVNCGPVEENGINGDGTLHFTLFKDRRSSLTAINSKVKIEDIPDGTSNTILLSENLDAKFWYENWTASQYNCDELQTGGTPGVYTRSSLAVRDFGFVWSPQQAYSPNFPTPPNVSTPCPRPSSKHPGTVVVAFADGTAKTIDDSIAIEEWLRAVCPDDEKARKPIADGGLNFGSLVPGF